MHERFLSLTKALKVPLLSKDDLAELPRLQAAWEHWGKRERQHAETRVAVEQAAAFTAFLAEPNADNEVRLLATADAEHTAARYATMRRACHTLRRQISAQAAGIVHPVFERVVAALTAEHARRREKAEPVMGSKDRHPTVIEARQAIDFAEKHQHQAFTALQSSQDMAPLAQAEVLLPPNTPAASTAALTPVARS